MRLSEIAAALEAQVLVAPLEDVEAESGGGSDSVSDVLVYGKPGMVLLTGLTQPSVVRAAQLTERPRWCSCAGSGPTRACSSWRDEQEFLCSSRPIPCMIPAAGCMCEACRG